MGVPEIPPQTQLRAHPLFATTRHGHPTGVFTSSNSTEQSELIDVDVVAVVEKGSILPNTQWDVYGRSLLMFVKLKTRGHQSRVLTCACPSVT